MAALTVISRSSLEIGGGGELNSDSPRVDVLTSDSVTTDNTEGEGEGERVSSTRDFLECLCRFLGGAGTRIRTSRFLRDANLFPTESEGRFDVSTSEKCLLQTLGSAVRTFSSIFKARYHCCLFFLFAGNRCMCTQGSTAFVCLQTMQDLPCHLAFPTRQKKV